jgi:hypothetical protein
MTTVYIPKEAKEPNTIKEWLKEEWAETDPRTYYFSNVHGWIVKSIGSKRAKT